YIVLSAIPLYKSYTIPFGDYAEKSYWAVTSVEAIQAAGIIAGFPDGTFRPQESATRAEVATIFARFLVMLNNDMK
ncbi:MAG: S-layer homology domain-containing protein, partial [Defluviitaleaceae bacterium]|nr:S-layer homology domain-containing protein [Defluviitaleaceae bacterium]